MPPPAPRLHWSTPARVPAFHWNSPIWAESSERCRWSARSDAGVHRGHSCARRVAPFLRLLFSLNPWSPQILRWLFKRCLLGERIAALAFDQLLAIFGNQKTTGILFRALLRNQPDVILTYQFVGRLMMVADAMHLFDAKYRKSQRIVFRGFD